MGWGGWRTYLSVTTHAADGGDGVVLRRGIPCRIAVHVPMVLCAKPPRVWHVASADNIQTEGGSLRRRFQLEYRTFLSRKIRGMLGRSAGSLDW